MTKSNTILVTFFLAIFLGCSAVQQTEQKKGKENENVVSLKNTFKDDFLIGVALKEPHYKELNISESSLVKKEFNSVTPSNDMKWRIIQPKKNDFRFEKADAFVKFGQKNDMNIIGHTLIWHSRIPSWIKNIKEKEVLKETIENHITTIVSRYKGKIDAWDVVNEALKGDGTPRESHFYKVFGDDSYIDLAFSLVAKADPEAKLIYNDYNLVVNKKRKGAIKKIKNLKKKGIRVDGVGIQAHWSLGWPSVEKIEQAILELAETGVKISFTELDINVLPKPPKMNGAAVEQNFKKLQNDPKYNPYPNGLPVEMQEKLSKRYTDLFKLFLKHQDKIERVTFWGVNDKGSWLNNWPIKGRTNYPLFFDRKNQPKKVYNDVISLKKVD